MIDKDLLSILACPKTHQPLSEATAADLAAINATIQQGQQKNVGGRAVSEPLSEGLVRADRTLMYPVRDGIPVLLIDEGLPFGGAPRG